LKSRIIVRSLLAWLFVGILTPQFSHASPANNFYVPPVPKDFSQTEFYLITVGTGAEVYTAFGHTLVRFIDRSNNTDVVYNWGVFDFNDPMFVPNFVYGKMNYRMDVFSMSDVLNIYRMEKRSVVHEKINLTTKQKKQFFDKIIWNSKSENLYYRYQYFLDNCSTKVRDYLNEVLHNRVREAFQKAPGTTDLRNSIRDHLAGYPFIHSGLEVLMNGSIDSRMSAWEEMYLPQYLNNYLSDMPAFDDNGQPIEGSKLLSERRVIYDFQSPVPPDYSGFQVLFWIFLVSMLFVWLSLGRGYLLKIGYRVLGLVSISWGLLAGFFGVAMILIWMVSMHEHGYHSANIWLYWPTDLILIRSGISFLKGNSISYHAKWNNIVYWNSVLHLILTPVFLGLFLFGVITQDVSKVLLYQSSIAMMIYGVLVVKGIRRDSSL